MQHMCGACARAVLFGLLIGVDIYVIGGTQRDKSEVDKVCCSSSVNKE